MLLNPHRLFYLDTLRRPGTDTGNFQHRFSCTGMLMREWEDTDYFYLEYKHGNCFNFFPLDEIMMPHELEALKSGKITLVLNNAHEAFHFPVEQFYKHLVLKEGIPAENILLISESADIGDEIARCAELFNVGKMKADWILQFEFNMKRDLNEKWDTNSNIETLTIKPYPKKFLNFNRRWRLHRVILVALLKLDNLLKEGHVSLAECEGRNWYSSMNAIKSQVHNHEVLRDMIYPREEEILNIPPLFLDVEDMNVNQADLLPGTGYLYEDSFFSVVTETNFYTDFGNEIGRFISEKTFKPIAKGHPFVILSVPRTLDKIRELGYKTFSPYIDESYDLELDDNERLLKAFYEIKRLATMSQPEIENFIRAIKPICDYNKNLIVNKTAWVHPLNY